MLLLGPIVYVVQEQRLDTIERSPAQENLEINYASGSSDQAKALSLYQFQSDIIDAVEDNKINDEQFYKAINESGQSLDQALYDSSLIKLPIESTGVYDSTFKVISNNLLDNLDHHSQYYFSIMDSGELRLQKVKVDELAVDETNQLIKLKPAHSKILARQEETVVSYGRLSCLKKQQKNIIFSTNYSEEKIENIETLLKTKDSKNFKSVFFKHHTNWAEVVYKHYPSQARFSQIKRKHLRTYLKEQFKKWQDGYDEKELNKILKTIIDEKSISTNGKTFKYLKDQRKIAAILRNGFYSYTIDGKAPPDFEKFVKIFGKLNDALQSENKNEAKKISKKLKNIINEVSLKKLELNIEIISAENLQKRMFRLTSEIAIALENDVIGSYEFHKMRKQLKLFLLLANDFRNYQDDSPISRQLSEELDHIITRLGDWHDTHIAHKLKGLDVLESFSINAIDRRLILDTLDRTTQIMLQGDCKQIFKSLNQ